MTGSGFWEHWYFHLPNFVLAALAYTLLGRFALSFFLPWKDWTLTPQYVYMRNDSNIPVIDFDRHQLLVTLRRDFY